MRVSADKDTEFAYQRFLANSFGQDAYPLPRRPKPTASDFTTASVMMAFPGPDPPEEIRERKAQPQPEIDALVASLNCPPAPPCHTEILIPFYSHADPWVLVYRQCSGCQKPTRVIVFMRLIDGKWWHGARDFDARPEFVDRTQTQIERALMFEVVH